MDRQDQIVLLESLISFKAEKIMTQPACPLAEIEQCFLGFHSGFCKNCQTLANLLTNLSYVEQAKYSNILPPSELSDSIITNATDHLRTKQEEILTNFIDNNWLLTILSSFLQKISEEIVSINHADNINDLSSENQKILYATLILLNAIEGPENNFLSLVAETEIQDIINEILTELKIEDKS